MRIVDARARIVLNSRGEPILEVEINRSSEAVPLGASRGSHEVSRLEIEKAVEIFNSELVDFLKTYDIQTLGDLKNFEEDFLTIGGIKRYGGDILLAIEYAILRAWANYYNKPIYAFFNEKPKFNIKILANVVGGGAHSKWRGPSVQEFLIVPYVEDIRLAVFLSSYIHKKIGERLETLDKKFMYGRNDEGAWVTSLDEDSILSLLSSIREEIKKEYSIDIKLGIDMAATHLYKEGVYRYRGKEYSREDFISEINRMIKDYKLFYVEDPLFEEDFEGFSEINKSTDALITGDDLTVTNTERIKKAIEKNSVKAVIIKPDQVGSLIKVIEAVELCKRNNIIPVLSHRSGETESNILAHLAVGLEIPFVKFGISGGERISKLNELIRIFEKIKS
ncbi:MAG: hypothetical protein BXU00_01000 [Candidatus Nanoclepta minutus]|uniref:phosphopyruvate hydratase n=1 Tax=Candidatus Nanoclepta minutus TaxID=1940235 RepID=A0A397WRH0_9ARCH|nr:MAG: hypothetical protein BXU00_01000 [Candidatus Nanoclepta minutus]